MKAFAGDTHLGGEDFDTRYPSRHTLCEGVQAQTSHRHWRQRARAAPSSNAVRARHARTFANSGMRCRLLDFFLCVWRSIRHNESFLWLRRCVCSQSQSILQCLHKPDIFLLCLVFAGSTTINTCVHSCGHRVDFFSFWLTSFSM